MQSACFFLWIAISLQSRPSPRFRFLIDAVEHILAKTSTLSTSLVHYVFRSAGHS